MATRLYGIVWRWHFLAGLAAAPLVVVIALTGIGYAFEPELSVVLDDRAAIVPRVGGARRARDHRRVDVVAAPACRSARDLAARTRHPARLDRR